MNPELTDPLCEAAERMVRTYQDWMAGCANGMRVEDVMAAHIHLRDTLAQVAPRVVLQHDESAWLVEGRINGQPAYFDGSRTLNTDPNEAIRFARETDANTMRLNLWMLLKQRAPHSGADPASRWLEARAVEHMWVGPVAAPEENKQPEGGASQLRPKLHPSDGLQARSPLHGRRVLHGRCRPTKGA